MKPPVIRQRPDPRTRRRLRLELWIVMAISLGQSAVYALLQLWNKLTQEVPLNRQTTTMNSSATPDRPWLDFSYQVAWLFFPLVPVLLVLYLLHVYRRPHGGPFRAVGFDRRRPWFDLTVGSGTFVIIGIAGLPFYLVTRDLGLNTTIVAANLEANWWTVPVLIARAVMNGVREEVLMIGYFFTRWRQAGGAIWSVILVSALIRGGYHLYQGFGGFVGNAVMGVLFSLIYLRTKRVMPIIITHALLDIVAFVGYALLKEHLSFL